MYQIISLNWVDKFPFGWCWEAECVGIAEGEEVVTKVTWRELKGRMDILSVEAHRIGERVCF